MDQLIEIRSYNLKPGTRAAFNKLFEEKALPMLKRWNIIVVAYGASLHDDDSYFLARSFTDLKTRQQREDAFYSSTEWKNGPREDILALIIDFTTVVIPANSFNEKYSSVTGSTASPKDLEQLSKLNAQFIQNFIKMDTVAHNEIIHKDFVCIENNGSIVGRKQYMKDWAIDYRKGGFTSFSYTDEFIRFFGNTALIRSKTIYTRVVDDKTVTGSSIYTDTYVKENNRWWCVQAQITPIK